MKHSSGHSSEAVLLDISPLCPWKWWGLGQSVAWNYWIHCFSIFLPCSTLRSELSRPLVVSVLNSLSQLWRDVLGPLHSKDLPLWRVVGTRDR